MYTKGPWIAQTVFCHDRNAYVRELIDDEGDLIAELKFETSERPKPNANESLIMASPELLEALGTLVSSIIRKHDLIKYQDEIANALEIIKKAKGE